MITEEKLPIRTLFFRDHEITAIVHHAAEYPPQPLTRLGARVTETPNPLHDPVSLFLADWD